MGKIKVALVVVGLLLSSCSRVAVPVGGNVGNLSNGDQEAIALDLFNEVVDAFKGRREPIIVHQTNHGEAVFANALRQSGIAVHRGKWGKNAVKLDFYYFADTNESVGVVTIARQRRVIKRYANENDRLIVLTTSVAWAGVSKNTQTYTNNRL